MTRQRLNRQLFIRFADPRLTKERRQAKPCAAAGGADGSHNISAGDPIRRGSFHVIADVHTLRAEMFQG